MGLTFEVDEKIKLEEDFDWKGTADIVLEEILNTFNCPFECEVYLSITDDKQIHQINLEQRDMDRATDVLSFPMIDWKDIADFEWAEAYGYHFNPESGELMLGDVIISYETLQKQASEYNHTIKREFAFLFVHSLLHLLGFDHMEDDERVVMEDKQKEIMLNLKIHR